MAESLKTKLTKLYKCEKCNTTFTNKNKSKYFVRCPNCKNSVKADAFIKNQTIENKATENKVIEKEQKKEIEQPQTEQKEMQKTEQKEQIQQIQQEQKQQQEQDFDFCANCFDVYNRKTILQKNQKFCAVCGVELEW